MSRLYFILWRTGLIGALGYAANETYGWHPAPVLIGVIVAIAIDTIAALWGIGNGRVR